MLRSWKIGSAFGIPVYIHPTFLLAPLLTVMLNGGGSGVVAFFAVALTIALFACVLLHEFGHALMARYFGINTRDITLYPIGGVARLEGMSEEPYQEILIAIAGPAVNVVIAGLLIPVVVLGFLSGAIALDDPLNGLGRGIWPILALFALGLCYLNIGLVLFNMIPAFPMDGGRVFRALLSIGLGLPRATTIAVYLGTVLAFGMGIYGMYKPNYMLPIVAVFVMLAGQQELLVVRYRERMKQAQQRLVELQTPGSIHRGAVSPAPRFDSPPVGRAVEMKPPAPLEPRHPAEPDLLFHFRVVEIPEPPRREMSALRTRTTG